MKKIWNWLTWSPELGVCCKDWLTQEEMESGAPFQKLYHLAHSRKSTRDHWESAKRGLVWSVIIFGPVACIQYL